MSPMVIRGFSEASGSWKKTDPAVTSSSRRMQYAVVDLPEPDSPTRATVAR